MKPLAQNTMIQGRYLIVQLIGKGGMGEVYLAVDQRLGSAVALKRTFFAGDETLGNAFEREARILARMRHPVLPKVSDHFGEGDEQYLVMEHISGDDLSKRLEVAQKPFPLSWVMFWADQLLDALSYLHSHEPPIIHRDIKPQNLKLTDENHIILLDFGLSKSSTGNTLINHPDGSTTGGSTASVVGYTPHYAPMEQIRGIGTSPRSDVYSLSATLYQLLTNVVPADALSRADEMLNGLADPIRALSAINHEIPQPVSNVILKGMEVSQDKRYGTAREMQKELRRAFASMQDSMSAKTVAFSADSIQSVAGDQPIIPSMDKTEVMDFGMLDAQAEAGDEPSTGGQTYSDPNANDSYGQNANDSSPKQSDLQTEVFLAGAGESPFVEAGSYSSTSSSADELTVEEENFAPTEDYGNFAAKAGGDMQDELAFSPDATMPIIALEGQQDQYSSAADQPGSHPLDQDGVESNDVDQRAVAAVAGGAPQKAKKKGSAGKIVGIFVGLFALFALALGAIGGGWYYYNNIHVSSGIVEPTPSPEPTLEITPTPEPTIESIIDSNANTDVLANTDVGSNNNANSEPEPEPEPTMSGGQTTGPRPRATPTPRPRATPQRPTSTPPPVVRPTATPRPRILQ